MVLDPRTGEVLALASVPAYDPNAFALGIDADTWGALNTNPLKPLPNRALQGRYSPGSVFKIAIVLAALEEGVATPGLRGRVSRRRQLLRRVFQLPRDARHGRHVPGDRKVLQYVFLHARQPAQHRCHSQVGHGNRAGRIERHRPTP